MRRKWELFCRRAAADPAVQSVRRLSAHAELRLHRPEALLAQVLAWPEASEASLQTLQTVPWPPRPALADRPLASAGQLPNLSRWSSR